MTCVTRYAQKGTLTLLRIRNVGEGYGPANDHIDVEVAIKLDALPGKGLGFQLRNDIQGPAHQGMLELLRDAWNFDRKVTIAYDVPAGKNNATIIGVEFTK